MNRLTLDTSYQGLTRRQAVRAMIRSAGGLAVVRFLPGCAALPADGSGGNGNGNANTPDLAPLLEIEDIDHVEGDREAANVIIEYGDFECPVCGDFFRDNKPAVITELVDSGQALFVFRHFPLVSVHPNARLAAVASECDVDFFEYHDVLFNNQTALARNDLLGYAGQVGLNTDSFESCLAGGAKVPRVDRDVDSGTRLGVAATPTFFVNGELLAGNRTLEDFQARLVE